MHDLHDRMPVILGEEAYDGWLDPKTDDTAELSALLKPFPSEALALFEVSPVVNSPRNDSPECVVPLNA